MNRLCDTVKRAAAALVFVALAASCASDDEAAALPSASPVACAPEALVGATDVSGSGQMVTLPTARKVCETVLSEGSLQCRARCTELAERFAVARAAATGVSGNIEIAACRLSRQDFVQCAEALRAGDCESASSPDVCDVVVACEDRSEVQARLQSPLVPDYLEVDAFSYEPGYAPTMCASLHLEPESLDHADCGYWQADRREAVTCEWMHSELLCRCRGGAGPELPAGSELCESTVTRLAECVAAVGTSGWGQAMSTPACSGFSESALSLQVPEVEDDALLVSLDGPAARLFCRLALPLGCDGPGAELCALRVRAIARQCARGGPGTHPICASTVGETATCLAGIHPEPCDPSTVDDPTFAGRPLLASCLPTVIPKSGVSADLALSALDDAQRATLCRWKFDVFGGDQYAPCLCAHNIEATTNDGLEACTADLKAAFTSCDVTVADLERCVVWSSEKDPCHRLMRYDLCRSTLAFSPCHLILGDEELPDGHTSQIDPEWGCRRIAECVGAQGAVWTGDHRR